MTLVIYRYRGMLWAGDIDPLHRIGHSHDLHRNELYGSCWG